MSAEPIDIEIRDESIRLGQLLKLAGLVDDGGAAREVVTAGEVAVNGEVETRRGRQVRPGDVVSFAGQRVRVGLLAVSPPLNPETKPRNQ